VTHQRDLIREYISYIRVEKGLSKNSLEAYERDLRKMEAWAAKNGLSLLTLKREELREWLMDLSRAKISENSKRRLISAVRGFYKFLMTDGHIATSPAEDLVSPQKRLPICRSSSTKLTSRCCFRRRMSQRKAAFGTGRYLS
jgi:integrase/recombinase XerD